MYTIFEIMKIFWIKNNDTYTWVIYTKVVFVFFSFLLKAIYFQNLSYLFFFLLFYDLL